MQFTMQFCIVRAASRVSKREPTQNPYGLHRSPRIILLRSENVLRQVRIGMFEFHTRLSGAGHPVSLSAATNASYITHGYGEGPIISRSNICVKSKSARAGETVTSS